MTARKLSVRQMAAALDVAKSAVARDARAGMPMTNIAAARAWRLANHDVSRTKAGRIDRPAPASAPIAPLQAQTDDLAEPPGSEVEPGDEHTSAYREHRATRERVNAERGQLELDQLRGSLIGRKDAERLVFTAGRVLRDAILNVPARIKDQLAAEMDAFKVEQQLEAELTAALDAFDPTRVLRDEDDDEADR